MEHAGDGQLTLNVDARVTRELGDKAYLAGEVKLGGGLPIYVDLNEGDRLTVTVADADGTILTTGVYKVGTVSFPPIEDRGTVIGILRSHATKVVL